MANNNQQSNIFLGQEEKGIDYFIKEFKKIIFDVLFVLLKDDESGGEDVNQLYFETILDYVQMHGFPFNQTVNSIWKANSFLSIIFEIFNIFNITNYLPNISYMTFIISMYILEFIILLMIIDIFYVGYSFSKKRFAVMWPLYVLRSVTSLVVTVLFLPITETLTNVMSCTIGESGDLVMQSFPTVYCYQGWHLFHTMLSLLFIFLFVMISSVVSYAFFEPRMSSGDRLARQDSKGEVAFILNKVVCQIIYGFLTEQQSWVLVLVTFGLSLLLFKVYNFDDPYYDFEVGLFYNIISSYYLWTNTMLLICQIFSNTSFDGGLVAWLIGLPFISSIMISAKKSRIDTLVRSQTKFRAGEQIQGHLRYVLQLIQNQNSDKNAYMLLVGYIEKHKETCLEEDCPLKSKKLRKKNNQQESEMDESIRNLLQELDRIFVNGLKKFPDCTKLRLSYAFFLIERMKNKNKAYEQLMLAEKGKPAFYEQFIIYRYQKIIKDNLDEAEESNADIVSLIAFDNHIQLCEEFMKLSANLHKEFWAELREDQPDLGKLNMIGSNISKNVNEAKDNYYKMQKINPNVPQSIKVFGSFLVNVLNDRTKGQELLKQAKQIKETYRQEMVDKKEDVNIDTSPLPLLTVSAKKQDLGIILTINPLFTTFFGYKKEDLVGKKINYIMPKYYAYVHDRYIKSFIENIYANLRVDGEVESQYIETDQLNYVLHKNGYIFPMTYKVILNLEQMIFITTFRGEATLKSYTYFIVNPAWEIKELSTGAISYFNLEVKTCQSKVVRLDKLIPEIVGSKTEFTYQVENEIFYFRKEISDLRLQVMVRNDDSDEENKEKEQALCKLVKLERIDRTDFTKQQSPRNKGMGNQSISLVSVGQQQNSLHSIHMRRQTNISPKDIVNFDVVEQQQDRIPDQYDVDQSFVGFMQELYATPKYEQYEDVFQRLKQVEGSITEHEDFSGNIHTRRLIDSQIVNINEEQEELFLVQLEEEEQEGSIFDNQGDNFEDEDDFKIFTHSNSTGLIKKALNIHHQHRNIINFKISSLLWMIFLIVCTILQYSICIRYFNSHKNDVDILQIVNNKLLDINDIVSRILDFTIVQEGLYGTTFNRTQSIEEINQKCFSIIQLDQQLNSPQYSNFFSQFDKNLPFRLYKEDLSYTEIDVTLQSALLIVHNIYLFIYIDILLCSQYILIQFLSLGDVEFLCLGDSVQFLQPCPWRTNYDF